MTNDLWVVLPILIPVVGAFLVYLLARLATATNQQLALSTSMIFGAALVALVHLSGVSDEEGLSWMITSSSMVTLQVDRGTIFVSGIALFLGLCVAVYSGRYISLDRRFHTYYPLLLLLVTGIIGMVMVTDLFAIYLFCELMSVASYVLVAFRWQTDTAVEAGFKYLILGTVATLIMLLGTAWVYRETGQIDLPIEGTPGLWWQAGAACFVVGLALKSGIVPLHTWLPDAYGCAPSSVSALLAGIGSKSTLYVLVRVALGLQFEAVELGLVLILLSFLNMTVGNALALVQRNTKRMLAYSSIAQAGYIMFALGIGLRYGQADALRAGFFLLLGHAAMKALAFLSKGVCHYYVGTTRVPELRGTFQRLPLVAVLFSLALLGLAGFPPLAGFTAKWFVLSEVMAARDRLAYIGAALFLFNSLLSLGYYLPLIGHLFTPLPDDVENSPISLSRWMAIPMVVLAVLVLAMGVAPASWLGYADGIIK